MAKKYRCPECNEDVTNRMSGARSTPMCATCGSELEEVSSTSQRADPSGQQFDTNDFNPDQIDRNIQLENLYEIIGTDLRELLVKLIVQTA